VSDDEWAGWVEYHAVLFGLDGEGETRTLLAWRETFAAQGFIAEELRAASLHLARDPPRYREEHLRRLQEVIHGRRAAARRADDLRREAEEGAQWVCADCHGCGWASVPHPRYLAEGEWQPDGGGRLHTVAVLCSCNRGRREAELHEKVRPLTLAAYELQNPLWRGQLAGAARARAAALHARRLAREADRERGAVPAPADDELPF
jgi:hypothetical protein